jgi:hypothetical protein
VAETLHRSAFLDQHYIGFLLQIEKGPFEFGKCLDEAHVEVGMEKFDDVFVFFAFRYGIRGQVADPVAMSRLGFSL